jgi:hypothetical protein
MKQPKVIFVGIHNKEGKQPLDSSTLSGKIIDEIIKRVDYECIKTNFFNTGYLPKNPERHLKLSEWYSNTNLRAGDIVVLLGYDVREAYDDFRKNFAVHMILNEIRVNHPAARGLDREKYINNIVKLIESC